MKRIAIAIDGPAAAGKSTIAKIVAKKLGYVYIDTGAMYRSVTWYALHQGVDCQDEKKVCALVPDIHIELKENGMVLCNHQDVTKEIRLDDVTKNVSYIASYRDVRLAMVDLQRKMAESVSVVMDGRDIGTVVLPNAEVKIYLTASSRVRAERRYKELQEKGETCDLDQIEKDIILRDEQDMNREISPLRQADDAVLVDSSDMSIEEVVNCLIDIVEKAK